MTHYTSKKGHQGFVSKYPILGKTKHIRVPITIVGKIKHIILLLESVAYSKGTDRVNTILDKVIDGLEDIIE